MSFFSEYKNVQSLLKQKHEVVFYAESWHYFQYYEQLIHDLLETGKVSVTYITSDKNDSLFNSKRENFKVVHVEWLLGFLFSKIQSSVMIMTMPDLGNYLFKRSAGVESYIYMFHAAVSTHQQYRQHAFDNYDAVFCTGDYQKKEIRRAEELYKLKSKEIIEYGYPLFDKLNGLKALSDKKTILVAPSWYSEGIFNTCFEELIKELSKLPYQIIIRSHLEYEKRNKKKFEQIKKMVNQFSNMKIDTLASVSERLPSSDILITDRSGIAFEFSFGISKPVLFIDTPLKINNPASKELNIEPVENYLRKELGTSVDPGNMNQVPEKINSLLTGNGSFSEKMAKMNSELFYNSPASYKAGLEYVLSKLNKN
jgi:hypothetical protein